MEVQDITTVTILLLAIYTLILLGLAHLVIRKVVQRINKHRTQRRPRARDFVPAHLQAQRIYKAGVRHLERRDRVQGVNPPGIAVRKELRKAARAR